MFADQCVADVNAVDWAPIQAMPFLLHSIERVLHRVLVGPRVCRDPKWLEAAFGLSHSGTWYLDPALQFID